MRVFKELPIVFPFYEMTENQYRNRENVRDLNQYKLISPKNALLPFQIEMPADKPAPVKWEIITIDGRSIDITNNLPTITLYEFSGKKQAVYKGDSLTFEYDTISEELNLSCGDYYSVFTFADDSQYVSEFFHIPIDSFLTGEDSNYVRVTFWNDFDLEPILYRADFRQTIYLDTFISDFVPEIDEEVKSDGYNNDIPIFQRLMLKYKFVGVVPDFIKIALVSLQIHDHVYIYVNQSRQGEISRVVVTATPHDDGGMNDVDVVFQDDLLLKKAGCMVNEVAENITTW